MPGFLVENFGCRATQADGAAIERQFEERGYSRVSETAEASLVVLNTCSVTAGADQDARAAIRRVRRKNPNAQIIVTGCYAQRAPEEVANLPGVTAVIGNSHKHQLAEIVLGTSTISQSSTFVPVESLTEHGRRTTDNVLAFTANRELTTDNSPSGSRKPRAESRLLEPESGSRVFVSDIFAHTELLAAPVFDAANDRTRPNLKIQDGCDNRCSFCVIPYVRGQSRSLETARIIHEVNTLVAAGYREVVISGINLGRWGRDLDGATAPAVSGQRPTTDDRRLVSLIRAILSHTSLEKLRISSVEPMDWTDDLIFLIASEPRIAKHAHVPMQSGSDAVLRRMHRKYRPWHYREKIEKIHAAMPHAAIGADVMVGFPGETDAEFAATRKMIEDLPFTYLHVFTYSARPGTPAADMKNQVPVHIARDRNRILRELAAEKKRAFMRSFIGGTIEAITLNVVGNDEAGEFTEALTDNYLKLHLRGAHKPNRWLQVTISGVHDGALQGE